MLSYGNPASLPPFSNGGAPAYYHSQRSQGPRSVGSGRSRRSRPLNPTRLPDGTLVVPLADEDDRRDLEDEDEEDLPEIEEETEDEERGGRGGGGEGGRGGQRPVRESAAPSGGGGGGGGRRGGSKEEEEEEEEALEAGPSTFSEEMGITAEGDTAGERGT